MKRKMPATEIISVFSSTVVGKGLKNVSIASVTEDFNVALGDAQGGISFIAGVEFVGMWKFSLFDPELDGAGTDAEFLGDLAGGEDGIGHTCIIRKVRNLSIGWILHRYYL
jgi:hypothetical protein